MQSVNDDPLEVLNFLDRLAADRAAGRERPLAHYLQQFPRAAAAIAEAAVVEAQARARLRPPDPRQDGAADELQQVRR